MVRSRPLELNDYSSIVNQDVGSVSRYLLAGLHLKLVDEGSQGARLDPWKTESLRSWFAQTDRQTSLCFFRSGVISSNKSSS
jgi:hypothetical protein